MVPGSASVAIVPTVEIDRVGEQQTDHAPIGTFDPTHLRLTIDGTPVYLTDVVRGLLTPIPHQFVVNDGHGHILRLVADGRTRTEYMHAYRGIREEIVALAVHRHNDGRIDVMAPTSWAESRAPKTGELALAVGLAAALGTRSVRLRNLHISILSLPFNPSGR
ncbi:hypothetical protein GORHZ_052_00070 [Gordonia rhizosphera NBRC 16068]|uniref:Uncharacterized protein n=1 Tax=Gordonia rhizosphera NBRC 16068 TaxID=1108045 RepID=K6WRF7_9ACTN|nr:hypothetical protein GORHZ_052_00070 [Gordonia rhizosphera NBRC 16068]